MKTNSILALDCNELFHAVLHNSESVVVRLLRSDSLPLYKRCNLGRTPLHVATTWPRGLSIIL